MTEPTADFAAGIPETGWLADTPEVRWEVAYSQLTLSRLSTEYVLIPVSATKGGSSYDPTGDAVQCAFMPIPTQVPSTGDWVSASWETVSTSLLYPYNIRCLVGPSGATALTTGNYTIYAQITDSPEIPVLVCGSLTIL